MAQPVPPPSRYLPECRRPAAVPPVFFAIDTETTGIDWNTDQVCSIAVVRYEQGRAAHEQHTLVNPGRPIPEDATAVHGITDDMVADAPGFEEAFGQMALPDVIAPGQVVVGHNVWFDLRFFARVYPVACTVFDTMILSRTLLDLSRHTLDLVCQKLEISLTGHHNALADAKASAEAFLRLIHHTDEIMLKEIRLKEIYEGLSRVAQSGDAYAQEKAESLLRQYPRWSEKQEAFARSLMGKAR